MSDQHANRQFDEGRPQRSRRPRGPRGRDKDRPELEVPRGNVSHLDKTLDQGRFVVFDIESTGGNPEHNGITEIFALRYDCGKILDTFYAMVNPEVPIPPIVRKMTGITNQMVRDAPPISAIMPRFVEFLGSDILVSHNTIGDIKFLRYFSEKVCGTPIPNYFLCTHLLVEKLVKEAPDKSLKGLSQYFEIRHEGDIHRAEGDAYLTLGLFKSLVEKLKIRGIRIISQAIRFQGDFESGTRLGWGVDSQSLKEIPASPGVFFLRDIEDQLSFVVGSDDMARELSKIQRLNLLPRPLLKVAYSCASVGFEACASPFAASLLEATYIERHKVRLDPSQWHHRSAKFIFLAPQPNGAWVLTVGPLSAGAMCAIGPVSNGKEAADLIDALAAVFQTKVGRKGLALSAEQGTLVQHFFRGEEVLGLWQRVRALFTGAVPRLEGLERLKEVKIPKGLVPIEAVNGVLVVREDRGYHLHIIVRGQVDGGKKLPGDLDHFLSNQAHRQQLLKQIAAKTKEKKALTPMTGLEALYLNRVLWWVWGGAKRTGSRFVSLEDLAKS